MIERYFYLYVPLKFFEASMHPKFEQMDDICFAFLQHSKNSLPADKGALSLTMIHKMQFKFLKRIEFHEWKLEFKNESL